MTVSLFIGRFQPFHKGHLGVARRLARRGRLVIAIGSSRSRRTADNPFSHAERKRMVALALKEIGARAAIVDVPDIPDDARWAAWVERRCPKFGIVYTGNAFVASLFRKDGYPVRIIKEQKGISATRIRSLMARGGRWQAMVPPAVVRYIEEKKLLRHVRRRKGRRGNALR
jgi:nicotinamide-nucleotide adenylyltransferase